MSSIPGYHGLSLHVDLTSRRSTSRPIPPDVLRQFIGGTGLGTWLLLRETAGEIDPLVAEAPLIVVFSPLVGSPLTTSAKFALLAKSPLTQRINDSLSSSHFAIAGKKTGYDAFVITGRSDEPTCLVIDNDDVRFDPAGDVWGQSSLVTSDRIRSRLGKNYRIAAIGPAGENLVRYATVSHDGRHAGRGGLGAVMGSKNLKAIAASGDRRTDFAHPEELVSYSKELSQKSFGPATAKYRELGTVANLLTFNRLGTLPTRNFQSGEFAEAARLAPETLNATHAKTRESCAACTIGCEHIYQFTADKNDAAGHASTVRMEYENLFALGPLCGISDPDAVLQASALCDGLGIDTISAGATIAFAMECAQRGLIDEPDLRFGNSTALLRTLEQIGRRDGIGDLLAEGSRHAADIIGQGSSDFAPHVKGLEIPGYEPRALQTMALGFAVATRGADHNRSGAYQADFSAEVDRLNASPDDVRLAIETEDEAAVMDSLILCKFLRGVFDDRLAEMARMLRLITGWDVDAAELEQTARRIVTAKKLYNTRQGWTPKEDTLPKRFLTQPLGEGASGGACLSEDVLKRQITAYNLAREWTADGFVPDDLQRRLRLLDETPCPPSSS